MDIIGYIFIAFGVISVAFGLIGMFRFKAFYGRVLASSLIDSAGFLSILIGVIFLKGISFFSFKVIFLLAIGLLMNPITTHILVRSAWLSGYKEDVNDDGNCP